MRQPSCPLCGGRKADRTERDAFEQRVRDARLTGESFAAARLRLKRRELLERMGARKAPAEDFANQWGDPTRWDPAPSKR